MICPEASNMICYDLHTITHLPSEEEEISIVNVRLHMLNNFLVIWDKVALDELDIVHRLTPNTRNNLYSSRGHRVF